MSIINKRLHVALINSYSAHKKRSFQKFQKLDLTTGQPKILSILYREEGYLQKDLAKRAHVEPATMTSLLNNMEKKGLIYKEAAYVSGGKRANAVYLTEKGREISIKVNKIVDDMEEISYQGFSDTEKELLINLLDRIQSNLQNY
ncbi:MAG: MarR family transcriptional regulator [Clostridiales bacterium]|jgi:DNA-binding MarR family transcriptional regulator|nr:MarR family transcriptional regulator [Clostridiales bacterium]